MRTRAFGEANGGPDPAITRQRKKSRPPWSRLLFCALIVGLQLLIVYPMVLYLSKSTKYAKKNIGKHKTDIKIDPGQLGPPYYKLETHVASATEKLRKCCTILSCRAKAQLSSEPLDAN